ncbi:threonine--tRNA ligase [Candidatus Peregrinibacteria bacterium CG10_big_fil_rev_8_21_14_0_10_36_19]|nr:MAG: threonine--tRNA ligase [Candidatus Peregrinibacteria bacterium CG10_big_fil_rev_8_21_14_0_10_36_19]
MSKVGENPEMDALRHSCAHVLAQAVLEMFPEAKLGIGPTIDNGFYYDFELPRTLIPEDLPLLEKKMKQIINQRQTFVGREVTGEEAVEFLEAANQPFKVELAQEFASEGKTLTFYENIRPNDQKVMFVDLCRGGHTKHTGEIGAFKLTKIAGAYWRGDEKKPVLQRIYGTAWETQEQLQEHLKQLEEAKKRDHRKLGKDLELFTFDEEVGAGLPLWLPKGAVIVDKLEELAKKKEGEQGYVRVRSPHIAKEQLYLRSGHLPYYEDSMYPAMEMDNEKYYLKAMNCPHHHKIYAAKQRSYRELPLRMAEYGHCYRFEDSGALFGLMRVRSLCMNDAHIYCTEEQFESEFGKVIELYLYYFELFGIEKYQMRLSKHSKEGLGKKYVDHEELWVKTEKMVRDVLVKSGVPFVEVEDEAAFYGPKIDVQIWSVIGREFTLATNQLDFAVPERFNLKYTDADGSEKTPICIHRAPLSTHERFIGFLIEHYAGAFPFWIAPTQVVVLPVSDAFKDYAWKVYDEMKAAGFRCEIDEANETLGKKIRNAEMMKIPYMLVVGEKEVADETVAVRNYATKTQEVMKLDEFVSMAKKLVVEVLG